MKKRIDILYAENNKEIAESTRRNLFDYGFQVRIAFDGKQTQKMFFSHIPDLLLLEIEIPDINGLELARIIRKKGCQTPIIIYSSHISATCELAAIKTGVDDCIPKNILPELLAYKLQNIYYRICQNKKNPQVHFISERTKYNASASILTINNKIIPMKPMDAKLLQLLCTKIHETASFKYLMEGLWGTNYSGNKDNCLRKCVNQLRKTLASDPSIIIDNVYAEGYRISTNSPTYT
ncbi:response regulator transcription factor [Butyricimonas synergistica]|uniref:response regulator transcription factor n=1 Tax=Butyricimonas synergistica TaxID=544644 RepID=UPI00036A0E71|nr:response regulator transcription factor [Butyricimonas synergistica]